MQYKLKASTMEEGKTYTDWKGNRITAGQTIVSIRTKPLFDEITCGFLCNGEFIKVKTIEPKKFIWEVLGEFKVCENKSGILFYTLKEGDYTVHIQLSSLLWMNDATICIKGLSDNEQDYYLKYFNEN